MSGGMLPCYVVKRSQRHDGPPPRSPTEATVALRCSPKEDPAVTEQCAAEYAELGSAGVPARTAADTEAAHELLSLAQGPPPPPLLTMLEPAPTPLVPLYTYTVQPTNAYVITEGLTLPVLPVQSISPFEFTSLAPQVKYVTYQPVPGVIPPQSDSNSNDEEFAREIARRTYDCDECNRRFKSASSLTLHKQTHRSLDSALGKRCGECGKAYVSMPALAMHMLTHQQSHVCDVCGKLFSRPWLLRRHLRSHTGEKPYRCPLCGKAFTESSNMRVHYRTHSSDKQHLCLRCHRWFAFKKDLKKHLETPCVILPTHTIIFNR